MANDLKEKEFFDYIKCPLIYEGKHERKLPFSTTTSYRELLTSVTDLFFEELQKGVILPLSALKEKWDELCEKNSIIITSDKNIKGVDLIHRFYLHMKDVQLRIPKVKRNYTMAVMGSHGHTDFKGQLGIIAVTKNDNFELYVPDFSPQIPLQEVIDMKLKYTLDSYVFYKMYNKVIGIHLHHVKSNRDFYSYRIKDDFKRLQSTIDNVGYAIRNKIFFPRENFMCPQCEMRHICKIWNDLEG